MSKTKLNATAFKKCECEEMFNFRKTDKGVIICAGDYRVSSREFKDFEDAEKYVKSKPYELTINTTILMLTLHYDLKEKNLPSNQTTAEETKND